MRGEGGLMGQSPGDLLKRPHHRVQHVLSSTKCIDGMLILGVHSANNLPLHLLRGEDLLRESLGQIQH